jgi:hypothetical protein
MSIISTKELFARESAISCGVAPLPTLACIMVRGFARLFLGLGIEGKGNRAVLYYSSKS